MIVKKLKERSDIDATTHFQFGIKESNLCLEVLQPTIRLLPTVNPFAWAVEYVSACDDTLSKLTAEEDECDGAWEEDECSSEDILRSELYGVLDCAVSKMHNEQMKVECTLMERFDRMECQMREMELRSNRVESELRARVAMLESENTHLRDRVNRAQVEESRKSIPYSGVTTTGTDLGSIYSTIRSMAPTQIARDVLAGQTSTVSDLRDQTWAGMPPGIYTCADTLRKAADAQRDRLAADKSFYYGTDTKATFEEQFLCKPSTRETYPTVDYMGLMSSGLSQPSARAVRYRTCALDEIARTKPAEGKVSIFDADDDSCSERCML